ncbi:hypothetical protein CAG99_17230 [Streptomyces marincola]|uniref:Nucleotidyltransferase n=2 Tax=Streptomyces marincola TaxID=2878388 RepID=A0A1W7CZY0_9ACTN|nr:hypothetical protein CAG99_17230 [Streptomyces marincola]
MSDPAGILSSMDATGLRPPRDRNDLLTVLRTGLGLIGAAVPRPRHRLVGTAAAALQGVDLPVGDVDLLFARRRDVDAAAAALAHLPCVAAPRRIEVSRQYYACYALNGVGFSFSTVEQAGEEDGWECKGPGPWRHFVTADCDGLSVDCVRLELRLTTEFLRDRPDRYRPLLDHLRAHGADLALLRQSLAARGIPERLARLTRDLPPAADR